MNAHVCKRIIQADKFMCVSIVPFIVCMYALVIAFLSTNISPFITVTASLVSY